MKTPKEPSFDKKKLNIRRVPSGPEYVLVDGYNIIFGWDDLKAIARDNLDLARHTLINMLSNYQGFRKCELILVFDAYKVKGNHREVEKSGGISIVRRYQHSLYQGSRNSRRLYRKNISDACKRTQSTCGNFRQS